eukprot:s5498_g4.t1
MNHPKQAKRDHGLQLPTKVSDRAATLLKAYGVHPDEGQEKLEKMPLPGPGPVRVVPKLDPDRLAQLVPPMLPSSPAEFRFQRPKTSHKRCRMPCQGAALLRREIVKPRGNPADLPVAWRRQVLQRPASSGAASRGHRDSEGRPVRPDRPRRSAGYRRMSQRLATVKETPVETQPGRRVSHGSQHSSEEAHSFARIISAEKASETRTFALWELYKLAREENLSVEEVVRMKQLFDDFDEDHGGTLDIGEFENVALQLLATQLGNTTQAQERARKLCEGNFKLMDSDGSGEVDFHEFLRWYSSRCFSESLLLSDSEREIRELAKTYGLDVHIVDKVKEYFDAADTNGSGHGLPTLHTSFSRVLGFVVADFIMFYEFKHIMLRLVML